MDIRIDGQHALVLGASQGIGRAVAHELAALGASITAVARDPQRLEALLAELPSARGPHRAIPIDVSDTGSLAEKMGAVVHETPIDIIVNNSGGPAPGPAHQADPSAFEAAFRQHLIAYQTVARAVVPGMKERGHGRIINIISTSVKQPLHNLGVSNTIRGAVANWAKTMANELGAFGITASTASTCRWMEGERPASDSRPRRNERGALWGAPQS